MTIPAPTLSDIKLIASDLDGTLLRGGRHVVGDRALPLIEALADRGVLFFAASGRPHMSLRRVFGPLADRIGYVCENGAMVIYRDEVLLKHSIPRPRAIEIFNAIAAHPSCEVFASGERTCYYLQGHDEFRDHLVNVTKCDVTPIAGPEDIEEPIIKIAFMVPAEENARICAHFAHAFGEGYRVVTSGTIWIDVTQDGVDKGTALAEVGERLGIAPTGMMAFGDELNDAEMLDFVGHPYLMETGNPVLRSLNDRIRLCEGVEEELELLLGTAAE